MYKKIEAYFVHIVAYASSIIASYIALNHLTDDEAPLFNLYRANLVGCVIIYLNCIAFNSFSLYDPYWMVETSCFSFYYFLTSNSAFNSIRSIILIVLVNIWSIKQIYSLFSTAIHEIKHEDWRYTIFRHKWGSKLAYFIIGFFSFIIMPNLIIFFASVPMYYVFKSEEEFNLMDTAAISITITALFFEFVSDYQLAKELSSAKSENTLPCMDKGLWSLCRHPNYFGEITFWFGLFTFGLASGASIDDSFYLLALCIGPIGVFSLIYFGSLPLMEARQLSRRAEFYNDYMKRVSFKILPLNFLFLQERKEKRSPKKVAKKAN